VNRREANGQRHDYSPCREMTPIPGRDALIESTKYATAGVTQLISQGIRPTCIDIPDNGVACAYIHVKYEDFIATLQADGDLLWEDGLERRKVTIKNIGAGQLLDKHRVQLSSNFGLWVLVTTTPVRKISDGAPELRLVRITGELPWDLKNWNPSKQPELWLQPLQEA
jgi:hypothetical protein